MPTPYVNQFGTTKNKVRLNNQDYEMSVSLVNPQGSFFPINTSSILSLIIEEDARDWFKRGTLVIKNSDNVLERRPNEFFSPLLNYKFRNDGRDILLVNIKPISNDLLNEPFPPELWELSYIFCVYDVEDISTGETTADKNLKLYFWELDYQLFTEVTINWSTNDTLYELFPELNGMSSELSDEKRKVPTGLALKGIINSCLLNKTATPTFADEWDQGATKILYSPPTQTVALEDFDYVFNRHASSNNFGAQAGGVPFLFRDRYTKTWFLTSFEKYFRGAVYNKSAAGPLQREQFLINNSSSVTTILPALRKTPQDSTGVLNIDLGIIGAVNNFQYVDMAAIDNTHIFCNTPVISNNLTTKQVDTDFESTNIKTIKQYFQDTYVNLFEHNTKPKAAFTLNKTKIFSDTINWAYSYGKNKIERYPDARNSILHAGIFLNQCLSFKVIGSTMRRSGVFIGLDRKTNQVDNDFDEKLLGQWFVINVKHEFTQDGYENTITGVKMFSDRDIRIDDDIA